MRKWTFMLLCLFTSINLILAQTKKISGTVASAEDGEPVIGASVVVKGTTIGTVTNVDGGFSLEVPSDVKTLIVSFVGMETQEVKIAPQMRIILHSSSETLDEVMVVAYGIAKKSSFTGSADLIKNEKLEARTVANVSKALEGTVAGIQTTSGGGQPGDGAKLVIRGFGSINANNDPLYVLDGVPYDGDISAINPADIESMSVLKDASASALYGARGANGVVIITTKKGKSGALNINLKATWGFSSRAFPVYDRVNESQYMELAYEAVKNSYIYTSGLSEAEASERALANYMSRLGGEQYNPFNIASSSLIDPSTGKIAANAQLKYHDDWFDESTRDNPLRQEYQFSVNGGNDKTTYMFSLGYLDEKGLAINTGFDRYSGRINADSKLKSWLKAGLSSQFSMTNQQYMQTGGTGYYNIWYSSTMVAPIYPVYKRDESGNYLNGEKNYDYGTTRPAMNNMNWVAALMDDKRERKSDNLSARTYIEIGDKNNEALGFFKDFKLTVNLGADYRNMNRLVYQNPNEGNSAAVNGTSERTSERMLSFTFNQLLNYNRAFGKHNLDVLVGHEYYSYDNLSVYAARQNFPFSGIYELANGSTITDGTSYKDTYKIESFLSRITYDFDDRFYLSGSYRTDGSSRFYTDSRWGNFWSVGGAWRISQEAFMENTKGWLNNLTLKASYGMQGNDNILDQDSYADYYAWQGLYDMTYPNANLSGAFLVSLENKELKWEKNKNLNVGIEANMFDSRLSVSAEFYVKNTSDLLLLRPMPTATGFNGYYDNIGDMRNTGVDLTFSGDIIRNDKFTWSSSLLLSTFKNKITKLSDNGSDQIISSSTILKVGEPINSFYLPKTAGVDPETGLMQYWIPGKDENGNEVMELTTDYSNATANGRQICGSRVPDLTGSFSNSFRYRDFDLSILTTFSIGGKIYDTTYGTLMDMRNLGYTWSVDMLDRWQKPGDITDVPRLQAGRNSQFDDRLLLNASYFSLKNVNLGYNLPKKWMRSAGMDNVRIFATGDNLFLISSKKGMDPQYNFTGTQDYRYAPIRTISLGVDIKF